MPLIVILPLAGIIFGVSCSEFFKRATARSLVNRVVAQCQCR